MRWLLAVAFAFLFLPTQARAFGQSGEYVVCEIAWLNLTPAAKAEVERLIALGGDYATFTQSCTFATDRRQRSPEHFANFPRDADRVAGPGCPRGLPCVITAVPNDLAILRSATASDADKSRTLKLFGYWVAVIHSPLHVSFADDRGGNDIEETGPCQNSLHSVWDTCIVERRVLGPGSDRYPRAREAAARLNASIRAKDARAWRRSEPWQWAAESFEIARQPRTGYCVRKPDGCWYSESERVYAQDLPKRSQIVDEAYLDWAAPIVEDRLRRAGIRLAHALNRTFDPAYRG
jgi:hypothetical protein